MNTSGNDFSVELASLPVDQHPLNESEQNVFNLFFYPEFEQKQKMMVQSSSPPTTSEVVNVEKQECQPKRTFFKKLLFALIATAILFLHSVTPLSSLLKVMTTKPVFAISTVLVYIIVMYFVIEKI
jgi:hypothetical protein